MPGKISINNKKSLAVVNMLILWLFCCFAFSSIYRNVTKSEPLGYYFGYKAFSYSIGDLVLLCISDNKYLDIIHKLGVERVSGQCKHNTAYLLKKIIAVPGDTVKINHNGITVNGIYYLNSKAIRSYDRINLLPQHDQQIHLKTGEFFVLGNSKTSFDSRYFGVIHRWQIAKKVLLLYATCN